MARDLASKANETLNRVQGDCHGTMNFWNAKDPELKIGGQSGAKLTLKELNFLLLAFGFPLLAYNLPTL